MQQAVRLVIVLAAMGLSACGGSSPPTTTATAGAVHSGFITGALPAAPALAMEHNLDFEPGMAVSPDGAFWITSTIAFDKRRGSGGAIAPESDPLGGLGNSDIWRSTDGGRSYQWIADPFAPIEGYAGLGGGDSDIAVANERNSAGFYNVYAASLLGVESAATIIVGEISLAVSRDGGATWVVNYLSAVPLDDRQWLAADGACTVYLAYHTGPTVATAVDKYDLCDPAASVTGTTLVPVSSSRYATLLPEFVTFQSDAYVNEGSGKIVVDTLSHSPYQHRVYIPTVDCGAVAPDAEVRRATGDSTTCPGLTEAQMLESTDGGATWSLVPVAFGKTDRFPLWPASAAVDAAGAVYFFWCDDQHVYLDVSRDGGTTWTDPVQVDRGTGAAIIATAAAGGDGVVEVAWYGSDRSGAAGDENVMGAPGSTGGAKWRVVLARSTDGGVTFSQKEVTGIVHRGAACTDGSGCDVLSGSRDLWEDFGMAISPTTGKTSIAYSTDEPGGDFWHDFTGYATEQ